MTKEEERKIIDALVNLFLEDDDLDIYFREQALKQRQEQENLST